MKARRHPQQDGSDRPGMKPGSIDVGASRKQGIWTTESSVLAPALPPDPAFFVSIHIPKTAGTTLGNVLHNVSSRRILFDYPNFTNYDRPDPLLGKHADFIRQYFRGVHGHFNVKRHLEAFGSAKFISCVRHPVERVISQYLHEYRSDEPSAIYHSAIVAGDLSVVDFAKQKGIGDAIHTHLEGLATSDYDLILVTEELMTSLNVLNYIVGNLNIQRYYGDPPRIPYENTAGSRAAHLNFDEATRRAIFECSAPDVEIYVKAVEALRAKARRFLG